MSNTVIKIEKLSKQYRLGTIGSGTLRGDFQRWAHRIQGKEDPYLKIDGENMLNKKTGEYVWALKDINLSVKEGEILGIIGKNGAGKSTLLKILSRVTGPTTGTINVKGRIASLLEVGTGFHTELTGRENIFLNGAILGMRKTEIRSRLDEIVEFAGVNKYIDTPVKRYSSGMYVRLAFAVAAHLEPEILVVDEVLAVGDAEFQQKAIGKMKSVSSEQGRTVLFVSHNMSSIESLCSSGILINNGKISYRGDSKNVVSEYLNQNISKSDSFWVNPTKSDKKLGIVLLEASVKDKNGIIKDGFFNDEDIFLEFIVMINDLHPFTKIGFELYMDGGKPLIASFHNDQEDKNNTSLKKGKNQLTFIIPSNILNTGRYFVKANSTIHRINWIYQLDNVLSFNVIFKLLNDKMQINKRPSIIAPILECNLSH